MLYVPFYEGDVASLKSLPCNEFIDLERPERIFDRLVWFPTNTCNNIFSLIEREFLLVKVQSGIPSATKDGVGLSFFLPGLLRRLSAHDWAGGWRRASTLCSNMATIEGQDFRNSLLCVQLFVCLGRPMPVSFTNNELQTRDVAG